MTIRRTLEIRTARKLKNLAFGVAATFALMGADGDGCQLGDVLVDPPPEPQPEPCPQGMHLDVVCDTHACDDGQPGDCYEICVPEQVCPEGTYEEWICAEPAQPGDMGFCMDPEGCFDDPTVGGCYPICVPVDLCGPGMHEEIHCEGDGWDDPQPPPPPPGDDGMGGHSPGDDGMGGHSPGDDGMGGYSPGEPELPEPPPDEPPPDPMEVPVPPPPPPGECFPICVPDEDDYPCPPGTFPGVECYEMDCWETCVPFEDAQQ